MTDSHPKTTVAAVVEATASTVLEMATTAKIILIVFLNFSMSPSFKKFGINIYRIQITGKFW